MWNESYCRVKATQVQTITSSPMVMNSSVTFNKQVLWQISSLILSNYKRFLHERPIYIQYFIKKENNTLSWFFDKSNMDSEFLTPSPLLLRINSENPFNPQPLSTHCIPVYPKHTSLALSNWHASLTAAWQVVWGGRKEWVGTPWHSLGCPNHCLTTRWQTLAGCHVPACHPSYLQAVSGCRLTLMPPALPRGYPLHCHNLTQQIKSWMWGFSFINKVVYLMKPWLRNHYSHVGFDCLATWNA